jgi:PucR family transcriptional regulator, purine catabolism regulatory protein
VDGESIAGQALIAAPAVRSAFLGLAEQRLRPLAQYDRANDSDLVGTLRAFLEHNGHWEAASTALGIHRHTLHNRVDRIEAMLGVDLESAHVRAELLLCLLTWR